MWLGDSCFPEGLLLCGALSELRDGLWVHQWASMSVCEHVDTRVQAYECGCALLCAFCRIEYTCVGVSVGAKVLAALCAKKKSKNRH